MRARAAGRVAVASLLVSASAFAQSAPYPPYPQPGQPAPYAPYPQPAPSASPPTPYAAQGSPTQSNEASVFEISTLYATGAAYGVGLGIWIDSELKLTDPGLLLISPALLGVAAPIGVYFLDQPPMPRGEPAAIAAGLAIGGAEGLGIAGTQFAVADKADAWGFRGLGRSVAIGSTVGGVGGYLVGETQDPSPKLSAFVSSGVLWGTLVGASFGYGASPKGVGYGHSNDYAALGGLVGLNVGLVATAGLSLVTVPGWNQISGMWIGAGIGAAASLPVYLFYAGDGAAPAKRGLVFTGSAILIGIAAGAIFASPDTESVPPRVGKHEPSGPASPTGFAEITSVAPFTLPGGGGGLSVAGILY